MKSRRHINKIALLFSLFPLSQSGSLCAAELHVVKNPVPGQYIVVLNPDAADLKNEATAKADIAEVAQAMATEYRAILLRSYTQALRGFVIEASDTALAKLLMDPRVAYVQEDSYVSSNATQINPPWGLDRIDQRDLPLNTGFNYDSNGAGVHAYIIDSNVSTTHQEFAGRIGSGFNVVGNNSIPNACTGHGTQVASIVGGATYGVAKGVTIHPVRVFDCIRKGRASDVIAGIDWVAANRILPAVANISSSTEEPYQAEDDAIANLTARGVTVVVSAGNEAVDACLHSPARAPSAITVGAIDPYDRRAVWTAGVAESNFGSCIDLFAPGHEIMAAWDSSSVAAHVASGTSYAAPHVAGAAALYLGVNPNAAPAQVAAAIVGDATTGRIVDPGPGSPNRLLYIPNALVAPIITRFDCPMGDTVPGRYVCEVGYWSGGPSTIVWTGSSGTRTDTDIYSGNCSIRRQVNVAVAISNAAGTASTATSFFCPR
jgi:serine protease